MTFKSFIALMLLSTVAAWVAWVIVLFRVDPFTDAGIGFGLFYASLWLSLTGTMTLLALGLRSFFSPETAIFRHVTNSFRQGMVWALLVIALLFFQSQKLLNWWNVMMLIFACILFEIFWLTYSSKRARLK